MCFLVCSQCHCSTSPGLGMVERVSRWRETLRAVYKEGISWASNHNQLMKFNPGEQTHNPESSWWGVITGLFLPLPPKYQSLLSGCSGVGSPQASHVFPCKYFWGGGEKALALGVSGTAQAAPAVRAGNFPDVMGFPLNFIRILHSTPYVFVLLQQNMI